MIDKIHNLLILNIIFPFLCKGVPTVTRRKNILMKNNKLYGVNNKIT